MNLQSRLTLFIAVAALLLCGIALAAEDTHPLVYPFDGQAELLGMAGRHQSPFRLLTAVGDPVDFDAALIAGGDYLRGMQADITEDNAGNGTDGAGESPDDPDDGGWDWKVTSPPAPFSHTTGTSSTNLYGETANGLYGAYLKTGDATYFTALTDAANQIKSTRQDYRTGSDIIFLCDYNDLPSVLGTEYADSARAKFDGVVNKYGAEGWGEYVRDARAGQGYENGIIPWDIGIWVRAAVRLGAKYPATPYDYAAAADSMAEVLWEDSFNDNPGYFDVVDDAGWDPTYANTDYYWYNLGVTGLIDAFDAAGVHTGEIAGLVTRLLDSQFASGAISFSYGANTDDEDWQSTAFGGMCLGRYDKSTYQRRINMMGYFMGATQDASGGWRYTSGNHYPQTGGQCLGALYYATNEIPDAIAVDPATVRCLSYNLPCDTVDVVFDRDDTTPIRGYSVTFELSAELELCSDIYSSIREGSYLSGISGTHFEVTSLGGGLYTVDCAILGIPCGATGNGMLFTLDIQGSGGDGTGTITVTNVTVRDCLNAPVVAFPGAPVDVTIDHTAPVAIGDISSTQVKTGNGFGDTTGVAVTFGAPVDAALVEVYRAGYGDYPEYDDGTGAEPAAPVGYPPGAPWTLTSVTASGQVDWPPHRDFWYYVVYTRDACGNVSLVSNKTTGTLNYHLGDVTDGSFLGHGENLVNSLDISLLGTNYWSTLIHNDPVNYLDVGPTTDYSVDALPTTDNQVQFEDLMMFAINFGQVSLLADAPSRVMETSALRLEVDQGSDILTARLVLDGNRQSVKGLHAAVGYGSGLELVSVSKGGLWKNQSGPIFIEHLDTGGVVQFDGAVLGRGTSLHGAGQVAELRFRVVGPVSELPHLVDADLRDRDNHRVLKASRHVDTGESESLARVEFGARPNPFSSGTALHFAIPTASRVTLKVFDVNGRLVTTLVDENLSAGRHGVQWESAGVSPGVYMAILQAGTERETRKLTLLP